MSSAILYLAIVAIWACVLVPRWLHRSHDNHSGQEAVSGQEAASGQEVASGQDEFGEDADPAGFSASGEPGADPVSWEEPVIVPAGAVEPEESTVHAEYSSVSYSMTTVSVSPGRPGRARPHPRGSSRPPARPASRARILQARRRLLTMLVALAIGTAACTVTGLMPWPVLIVPVGLVGLYLLLLREAAAVDAENARRRAEADARSRSVRAARARALRERARQAQAVPTPQANAEVIDISALAAAAGDQLYDQYADAETRAVGD